MIVGIILAGGDGTRINSKMINKAAISFLGKPMVAYGVDLLDNIADLTIVTTGAFDQSIKSALKGKNVIFAHQESRLGTADAVKIGLKKLETTIPSPNQVLVGYGDHLMFYSKSTVRKMLEMQTKRQAAIVLITFDYDNPDELAFGRIVRDRAGDVVDIIEQKDATADVRKIKELNAGFYCFDYSFLKDHIVEVEKSPVTHEYYLTDMLKIALKHNKKVAVIKVPFKEVGIGVNTVEDMEKSTKLYQTLS